jgi:hypothetical protein
VHIEYQGHEALVALVDGEVIRGSLLSKAQALVRQWCLEHHDALAQNWLNAQALRPLSWIPGADND